MEWAGRGRPFRWAPALISQPIEKDAKAKGLLIAANYFCFLEKLTEMQISHSFTISSQRCKKSIFAGSFVLNNFLASLGPCWACRSEPG
jgi:hypothetical protein